ncbi:sigma-70 family RNA polymerase sigma factor [Gloeocapsa sp. PCC 73106]|uniref:sigma-70 family RNA polymerase sigma factor n=1 Tax=Gloeocapsa sp. PCC 73106 TaxID=102232 RepID=UPI0002ABE29C|nr:sigma-70 family RNA polymerase sigma factor [Gloeocapsa sp. PCC 73106]ELR98849.1 RNA polymerase sigma factor, sigma-70 family [Gloeocapsa sp. PCC 73106]
MHLSVRIIFKVLANELEKITDKELVLKASQGEHYAFRLLYRRYLPRVRSTLYQLCGNCLLDDLVQEVFLRTWKNLPKLRQPDYFSTWLYRITWNVATDNRRKFAQQEEGNKNLTFVQNEQKSLDVMELHYQDLTWRGLQTLSFDHRAVLILHDLEDLPQKEVAKILGIPIGTVKSRLFHARNTMRTFLTQQGLDL